jgi:hypothetical protein
VGIGHPYATRLLPYIRTRPWRPLLDRRQPLPFFNKKSSTPSLDDKVARSPVTAFDYSYIHAGLNPIPLGMHRKDPRRRHWAQNGGVIEFYPWCSCRTGGGMAATSSKPDIFPSNSPEAASSAVAEGRVLGRFAPTIFLLSATLAPKRMLISICHHASPLFPGLAPETASRSGKSLSSSLLRVTRLSFITLNAMAVPIRRRLLQGQFVRVHGSKQ